MCSFYSQRFFLCLKKTRGKEYNLRLYRESSTSLREFKKVAQRLIPARCREMTSVFGAEVRGFEISLPAAVVGFLFFLFVFAGWTRYLRQKVTLG